MLYVGRISPEKGVHVLVEAQPVGGVERPALRDMIAEAVGEHGLDGVVNNAGIYVGGPLEFTAIDDLCRILDINLVGAIAVLI